MGKYKNTPYSKKNLTAIVPDSMLLVLYLIGSFDPNQISKYKRSNMFTIKDFHQLNKILNSYRKIILNQPIITEACNHLDKLNESNNCSVYPIIKNILLKYSNDSIQTHQILNGDSFIELGFADSSLEVLSQDHVIITAESSLYGRIMAKSGNVLFWEQIKNINY